MWGLGASALDAGMRIAPPPQEKGLGLGGFGTVVPSHVLSLFHL